MSRIDSGRITLNEEPFSLADLIHDISVVVRPQAAQKNQELKIEIGRIEEENLLGDSRHLRRRISGSGRLSWIFAVGTTASA